MAAHEVEAGRGIRDKARSRQMRGIGLTMPHALAPSTLERWLRRLPPVLFALAAVLATALVAQYVHAMATTSLWVDEYYTIVGFAAKGPWFAWTDYHEPNNHILFSIVSSLWPARIAHEPFAARLPSFIAVAAAFAVLGWFAVRERAWGGGAVALLLLADTDSLDLTLQARGYGFTMLAAIVQAVAIARYLSDGARPWLIAAAAAAFVGTASLPIYILLAAPLSIGLLILRPRREVLVVLGVAALLGIGFYLPTAAQVISAASAYAEEWGTHYATLDAVRQTLLQVLPRGWSGLFYSVLIVAAIGLALVRSDRAIRSFIALCLVSLAVFFAACLVMTTPLVRTTQFAAAVVPVLLVAATGTAALGSGRLRLAVTAVLLAATIPLVVAAADRLHDLRFRPLEAGRETARVVEASAPPDAAIFAPFRHQQLAVYLADPGRFVDAFDAARFRNGGLVVVDSNFRSKERFTGRDHAAGAIDLAIPQRRGGRQVVSFVPQTVSFAARAAGADATELDRIADGDVETGWRGSAGAGLTVVPQAACARLLVLGTRAGFAAGVDIRLGPRGAREPAEHRVFRLDRLVVVDLGERAAAPIRLVPKDGRGLLEIDEVWCAPQEAEPDPA